MKYKIKTFFEFWWGLFAIILISIIIVFSLYKLQHSINLKVLHSYDYVFIGGVIYNTEDIDDISCFNSNGTTFYIKGTDKTIRTTQYTYFDEEELDKYLKIARVIKEKEILID